MENKKENIIDKYLNTKKKKIIAGCVAGVLVIGCAGAVILNTSSSKELVLASDEVKAEFGQRVSTNIADYLDANKSGDVDKIIKDTKEIDKKKLNKYVYMAGIQKDICGWLSTLDRKSTRLNSSHLARSRMPSSA